MNMKEFNFCFTVLLASLLLHRNSSTPQDQSSQKVNVKSEAIPRGGVVAVSGEDGSRRLFKDLFNTATPSGTGQYRALVRAVEKYGDTAMVQIGLALVNIHEVNFDYDSLTTSVWVIMEWNDPTLRWKPINYGDITQIPIPVSMIWSPDVTVFNSLGEIQSQGSGNSGLATVDHNGKVLWVSPRSLKTHCELESKAATHVCSLRLGSWSHNPPQVDFKPRVDLLSGQGMNLTMAEVNTSPYLTGKQWRVVGSRVDRRQVNYEWMPGPVTELQFTIRFSATTFDGCKA